MKVLTVERLRATVTRPRWILKIAFSFHTIQFTALSSWHFCASMIEVICNDRLGKKIRVKCNPDDTVGDLKKLLAAQTGTRPEKLRIQKWYTVYKDHITLDDYEIHDGMGLELYCAQPAHECTRACYVELTLSRLFLADN